MTFSGDKNNFDDEVEGTSPPAGCTDGGLTNFEIDDGQYRSSPHSCWIYNSGGSNMTGVIPCATGVGVYYEFWVRPIAFGSSNMQWSLRNASSTEFGRLIIYPDGSIYVRDGAVNTDSTYDLSTGSWQKIRIEPDYVADTYTVFLGDVEIYSDAAFGVAQSDSALVKMYHTLANGHNYHVDDIEWDQTGWTGTINGVVDPAKINAVASGSIGSIDREPYPPF